jgi:hypothetical protein
MVAGNEGLDYATVLRPLGRDLRSGFAAVRRREADQLAAVVVADGGQRAEGTTVDHDPRTPTEDDAVVRARGREVQRAQGCEQQDDQQDDDCGRLELPVVTPCSLQYAPIDSP